MNSNLDRRSNSNRRGAQGLNDKLNNAINNQTIAQNAAINAQESATPKTLIEANNTTTQAIENANQAVVIVNELSALYPHNPKKINLLNL